MEAEKGKKYLVIAATQGIGATVLALYNYNWPENRNIHWTQALLFVAILAGIGLLIRLLWIFLSSYLINISKFLYYKITREKVISFCLCPFFWYESKFSWANIFWIYDDRTCFAMNEYLKDKSGYEKLCSYILKRNRILLGIYVLFMTMVVCCFWKMEQYAIMWMVLIGGIEHIMYQMEYKKTGSANAMAFAGVTSVNVKLILHMLVNQSKIEGLSIGREVVEILSSEMYDANGGYFFNYLCLNAMFHEICDGQENEFVVYMDEKVNNIKGETNTAMELVKGIEKQFAYKYIAKEVCLFYVNYREFLLYVLMYYKLKDRKLDYMALKNYIKHMLSRVENECVKDSILSENILTNKFEEYKGLYENVLKHSFKEETSIFTGYDTLPVWNESRSGFVRKYNESKT